jgi:hypothetical protein
MASTDKRVHSVTISTAFMSVTQMTFFFLKPKHTENELHFNYEENFGLHFCTDAVKDKERTTLLICILWNLNFVSSSMIEFEAFSLHQQSIPATFQAVQLLFIQQISLQTFTLFQKNYIILN